MTSIVDVEQGAYEAGYPALAHFMAQDPDNETLIFRRFDSLATRNLLYLQAELFEIERKILEFESSIVARKDVDLIMSIRRWETFITNAKSTDVRPEQDMSLLIVKLRETMKGYQEALVLQSQIARLNRPNDRALKYFRRWFRGESRDMKGKPPSTVIAGEARKMLDKQDDLVALKDPEDDDRLSNLLRDHWPLKGETGSNPQDGPRYFRLRHVTRTVAVISTIVAAVELVGAITTLYFVQNRDARIGLIALFTSLFGFSLCLLTNSKRGEIYGASAAYAAVLVVFVSGDLGAPAVASFIDPKITSRIL